VSVLLEAGASRILEKEGFAWEGLPRDAVVKDGRLHDLAVYARLREG
jgi:hypothetical protein